MVRRRAGSVAAMQTAQPQAINGLIFALEGDLLWAAFPDGDTSERKETFLPKAILAGEPVWENGAPLLYCRSADKKWEVTSTYGGK
ncbi:MAG: hypothetical protein V8S75_02755 [[Ruminococcus] torques]